jgi:hypothetical protein
MIEGFWLGFGCWGSCHGRCSFGGGVCGGEEVYFLGYGAPEVIEGFAKVGWVVVGFVGVLGAGLQSMNICSGSNICILRDLKHLLVYLLESIDTLLKLDIVRRELSLQ